MKHNRSRKKSSYPKQHKPLEIQQISYSESEVANSSHSRYAFYTYIEWVEGKTKLSNGQVLAALIIAKIQK